MHFLTQAIALSLRRFFDFTDGAAKTWSEWKQANTRAFRLIATQIGLRDVSAPLSARSAAFLSNGRCRSVRQRT